jgi:hypothetical protein
MRVQVLTRDYVLSEMRAVGVVVGFWYTKPKTAEEQRNNGGNGFNEQREERGKLRAAMPFLMPGLPFFTHQRYPARRRVFTRQKLGEAAKARIPVLRGCCCASTCT